MRILRSKSDKKHSKKNTINNPHSGKPKYYGKGRKKDVSLGSFDDKKDAYWTSKADKWIKDHDTNKGKG